MRTNKSAVSATPKKTHTVTTTKQFNVIERWVEITVWIDPDANAEMNALRPFCQEQLQANLYLFGVKLTNGTMEAMRFADFMEALTYNEHPEMELVPFRAVVPQQEWRFAEKCAAMLGVSTDAYLRTGIWDHVNRATANHRTNARKSA